MSIGNSSEEGVAVITVKKAELLEKIRANRTKHETDYKEALKAYRDKAITLLAANLEQAKAGGTVVTNINLLAPEQHLKDYDRVIMMLTMSIAEEIKITEEEFNKYVMDEWRWKHQFEAVSASYRP